jgi:periplasmic protein TonB
MAILGVLLVGPLLYTQVLPMVQIPTPLFVIADAPPPPPAQRVERPITTSGASLGPARRTFVVPRTIPPSPIRDIAVQFSPADLATPDLAAGLRTEIPGPVYATLPSAPATTEPPRITQAVEPPKIVRLSEGVLRGKLVTMIKPPYPSIARQARVSGTVKLLAIIGKDGRVRELSILEGHAMLRQAAYDAVRQWVYSPTIVSGTAVEVEAPIDVNFALN